MKSKINFSRKKTNDTYCTHTSLYRDFAETTRDNTDEIYSSLACVCVCPAARGRRREGAGGVVGLRTRRPAADRNRTRDGDGAVTDTVSARCVPTSNTHRYRLASCAPVHCSRPTSQAQNCAVRLLAAPRHAPSPMFSYDSTSSQHAAQCIHASAPHNQQSV